MAKRMKLATKRKDKSPVRPTEQEDEESLFQSQSQYASYIAFMHRKVEPLKCFSEQLLQSFHLPELLAKYNLGKFLTFKGNTYRRLVKMFYANLAELDGKISCYVMHKHIVIDCDFLANEFEMDNSAPKLTAGSFPDYNRELAIKMLFPYSTPKDGGGKLLITGLSPEDRILHYALCKVILPRITNFTQIVEDELFLMWIIKNQIDFNFPYFILKYMAECSKRSDIGYLPYGMILTPIFAKFKIKFSKMDQLFQPNITTMITASHLHKIGLVQDNDGKWVKKRVKGTQAVGESSNTPAISTEAEGRILEMIERLHKHMNDQLQGITGMVQSIEERLSHIESDGHRREREGAGRLDSIESQLQEITERMQQQDEEAEIQRIDSPPDE